MVARVKNWVAAETLTAADLNAEFNNVVNSLSTSTADHIDLTDIYAWTGAHSWSGAATHTNTLTVGVDDTGHDVKFFGATSGQYMLWDESADELVLAGDTKLSFHDAAGGENIIATSNGHLEVNAGTTLDITAPTVDLNSSTEFNIDTAAYDLNASGAVTIDGAGVSIDSSSASNLTTSGGALTITSAAAATWSTAAGDLTLGSGAAINITPAAGSAIVLDGTINVDAGVVTGATSITLSGELDAGSLDVSGNADIDGTLEADAYTVDGTALNEYIADTIGAMVTGTETGISVSYDDSDNTLDFVVGTLNQDTTGTAAIATTVTITDNESTNEDNAIVFTAGGDVDGGNLGLESDGTLTYNPSTGKITATGFIGALTGDVTGDVTGNADTFTATANNSANETVYPVFVDGATGAQGAETDTGLTYNPSTGLLSTAAVTTTGVVTAAGFTIGSAVIAEAELETIDGVTAGTVAASKAVVVDSNKDAASFRNITLTGELDAGSLDVSGDADIDGTLEADAITLGGTALGSLYSPIAGSSSIVTTGALNSGSITSGFGNINTGSSTITTTGAVSTGALTSTGNISFDGGSFVFNESGADKDFRIEGDTNANLFVADASEDKIGFGTATPGPGLVTLGGGVAATTVRIDIDGGSDNGKGAQLAFRSGGTDKFYIGDTASLQGGSESSRDISIYTTSGVGIRFYTGGNNRRMTVDSSGNVGIAMVPGGSHKLDVTGSAGLSTGTAWTNTSDARIKTSVATITGATAKIKRLRPVSFRYTADYLSVHPEIDGSKTYHSFIADEYETVFPDAVSVQGDLVRITPAAEGRAEERETLLSDLKQFTPHDLQMFLAAAIQELDARITELEAE